MAYEDELIWAEHPQFKKPVQMTRGQLEGFRRLGFTEIKGEHHEKEESIKKEVVQKGDQETNNKEKSNEYKRLISEGVIKHVSRSK